MHDLLLTAAFVLMLLSPCIVAATGSRKTEDNR